MGRTPVDNPLNVQLAFRVDKATAEAIDVAMAGEERPGLKLSRNDMARMLVAEALETRAKRTKSKK